MARVRVVTRTIENVVAECKVMVTVGDNDVIETMDLDLGGQIEPKNALKVAQKIYNSEDFNVVKVLSTRKEQQIYGMLETDFIKLARKMNDERHFIDGNSDDEIVADDEIQGTEEPENQVPEEPEKGKGKNK